MQNTLKRIELKEKKSPFKGSYVFRSNKSGEIKWTRNSQGQVVVDKESFRQARATSTVFPRVENSIVSSSGYGRNLVLRQLIADTTYGIAINSASIGTGTPTISDSTTALTTSVLSGIVVADTAISNDQIIVSFFIPSGDLANGTYKEFGIFIGTQLFAISLIAPNYTKGTNQDTSVDYTISLT